jgi:hypothetical protein
VYLQEGYYALHVRIVDSTGFPIVLGVDVHLHVLPLGFTTFSSPAAAQVLFHRAVAKMNSQVITTDCSKSVLTMLL